MRFRKGQEVVCVKPTAPWIPDEGAPPHNYGPKENEIVTVDYYNPNNHRFMVLVQYSDISVVDGQKYIQAFDEQYFEPLAEITEVMEILNTETVEA